MRAKLFPNRQGIWVGWKEKITTHQRADTTLCRREGVLMVIPWS
jgi:hypothetical protein